MHLLSGEVPTVDSTLIEQSENLSSFHSISHSFSMQEVYVVFIDYCSIDDQSSTYSPYIISECILYLTTQTPSVYIYKR